MSSVQNKPKFAFNINHVDRWGVIDRTGKYLVEPGYRTCYYYGPDHSVVGNFDPSNALANSNASILDATGRSVFTAADIFEINDGVAFFQDRPSDPDSGADQPQPKFGIVDVNGHVILPPTLSYVDYGGFVDGLAVVQRKMGTSELIDKNGRTIFKFPAKIDPFPWISEGLIVAKDEGHDGNYLIYDLRGNVVVRFDGTVTCDQFSEGLAPATQWKVSPSKKGEIANEVKMTMGFIDKAGKFVISPKYENASQFHEGLAAVFTGSRWEYIDRTGKVRIQLPTDCSSACDFSEGYAAVAIGGDKRYSMQGIRSSNNAKWGFINQHGEMVIAPQFFSPTWPWKTAFSGGLALVASGNDARHRYGFIDYKGNWVIALQFKDAYTFKNGAAAVCVGPERFIPEQWAVAEHAGKWIRREELFERFQFDYPIIGMTRTELHKLLGPGDDMGNNCESYPVTTWWCANACRDAGFKFEGDKVVAWSYVHFGGAVNWLTTNSLYQHGTAQ